MAASKAFLFFTINIILCAAYQRQDLNGQWTVTGGEDIVVSNATVPGGIFSDLMNAGVIGDIFVGTGDMDYSWVGETDWTYSKTFTVDEAFLAHQVVLLVFEGLDTFATVSINGVEILSSENMFVRYYFSVKSYLQVGSNEIVVSFISAVTQAATLAADTSNEYVVPPECPPSEYKGICHVNRIRKMQASFSWDWGPAFASVGLWKEVYLDAFDNAVVDYVVAVPSREPGSNIWRLDVMTTVNGGEIHGVQGSFSLNLQTNNGTKTVSRTIETSARVGLIMTFSTWMEISIDEVNTWWPNGFGTQDLYNLTVSFSGLNEVSEKTVRVGFRTVELVQEETSTGEGLNFYFKINDQPIFAKGANEIPISILPEKGQDPDTIRRILQTARDTNMNMLRVWGGGNYESDYFYDLADEYGLLIWQDFMFACAMYPVDATFLNNVRAEVQHQVRRLASHPSIVLWAGNNENEGALRQDWYGTASNFTLYEQDYVTLYVDNIRANVLDLLPVVIFVTSSPSNGLSSEEEGYVAANPADPLFGDVHFYDYTSDSWSSDTFPIPRFASEYGYQSYPSLESWLTATGDLEDLNPSSDFMDHRQHHPGGNTENLNLIEQQLQLPDSTSESYVNAFLYFSQIVQAQSIKVETEHYRSYKGRYDSTGHGNTMGALYWQLNDVWVAPTWSGMDYIGRWKMLQYFTQEFFNPLLVTGRLTSTDDLEIYAVLDQLDLPTVDTKVVLQVYTWNSLDSLVSIEFPVTLDPTQAVLVTTINAPTAFSLAGCGDDYAVAKAECFFHLQLMDQNNNELAPINYVFPEKLKNSNLPGATVKINSVNPYNEDNTVFEIVVTTNWVALFVWLDSHEISGRFSENGFLQVVSTKTVYFTSDEPIAAADLTNVLTVTHLRDPAYS